LIEVGDGERRIIRQIVARRPRWSVSKTEGRTSERRAARSSSLQLTHSPRVPAELRV
jgi:hypothetical protein